MFLNFLIGQISNCHYLVSFLKHEKKISKSIIANRDLLSNCHKFTVIRGPSLKLSKSQAEMICLSQFYSKNIDQRNLKWSLANVQPKVEDEFFQEEIDWFIYLVSRSTQITIYVNTCNGRFADTACLSGVGTGPVWGPRGQIH